LELAKQDEAVHAVIAIGSSARTYAKADEYSDMDLIVVTDHPHDWLYGDCPDTLGVVKISFVEQTLGGGLERRILFEGSLDTDLVALTPQQLLHAVKDGVAQEVMNRGYAVLYDNMGIAKILEENCLVAVQRKVISENEFRNAIEDFWFHAVWASKKMLRGELWTAKMCIDAYMKKLLLQMIENEELADRECDVWHSGRFLEKWAKESTVRSLKDCFAHYEKSDMISALYHTAVFMSRVAHHMAALCNYAYPEEAEEYARALLKQYWDVSFEYAEADKTPYCRT